MSETQSRKMSKYDRGREIPADHHRYTPACLRLLAQYKTIQKVDPDVPAVEAFMREYKVEPPC